MSVPDTQSINRFPFPAAGRLGKFDLELPAADPKRWSSRRKAAVVVAIRYGIIARAEARKRYALSEEELAGWEIALARAGVAGLRRRPRHSLAPLPQNPAGRPSLHDPG